MYKTVSKEHHHNGRLLQIGNLCSCVFDFLVGTKYDRIRLPIIQHFSILCLLGDRIEASHRRKQLVILNLCMQQVPFALFI